MVRNYPYRLKSADTSKLKTFNSGFEMKLAYVNKSE